MDKEKPWMSMGYSGDTILLEVSKGCFHDPAYDNDRRVPLGLPAPPEELMDVLDKVDAWDWREAGWRCADCVVPQLKEVVEDAEDIHQINQLAGTLAAFEQKRLTVYQAVLQAAAWEDIVDALRLAERLEDYILVPTIHTPEQLARDDMSVTMAEETAEGLLPYLDLDGYGKFLLAHYGAVLTDYGLVQRQDGQPVRAREEPASELMMN